MNSILTDAFDAFVSLSASEHIPLYGLENALEEIRRKLKQESRWAVTTPGTERKQSWFHHLSRGYCFSSEPIEEIFQVMPARRQKVQTVLKKYWECTYLKKTLPNFYLESQNNRMPWGNWDLQ
jgi:hypothetical protein